MVSQKGAGKQHSETLVFGEGMGLGLMGGPLGIVSLKERGWARQWGPEGKGRKEKDPAFH